MALQLHNKDELREDSHSYNTVSRIRDVADDSPKPMIPIGGYRSCGT